MNIVIISTSYTVKISFNDYSDKTKTKCVSIRRDQISEIAEESNASCLVLALSNGTDFKLSCSEVIGSMVVDSVDGVSPTDNDDLFDKLLELQQV